jgi:hypothetical protein
VFHDVHAVTEAEAAWLAYARAVLSDLEHRRECAALGASPEHPGVDATDLRWPGYLGADYVAGEGALCVGNVHRNFASGRITSSDRDRLVAATRGWRDGLVHDTDYLDAVRSVYLAGFAGWTVGKHLRFAVHARHRLSQRGTLPVSGDPARTPASVVDEAGPPAGLSAPLPTRRPGGPAAPETCALHVYFGVRHRL